MSGKQLVRKLLGHAVQHARAVASALIIAGYVGFFLLPITTRDNFFDENSLLVSNSATGIWNYVKKYQAQLIQPSAIQLEFQNLHTLPLDELLLQHGLVASKQTFLSPAGNKICTNYHVSTRSRRGDGSESLALVTPLSAGCTHERNTGWGTFREACWPQSQAGGVLAVSVGVALSKYLASVPWLARDFFWVIPDASCGLLHSTQAWIEAARGYREAGILQAGSTRVGLMQQALVLEVQSMGFKAADSPGGAPVEVSGVGAHGLLPKLDFFMLAEYFFRVEARVPVQLPWRPTPLLSAVKAGLSKVDSGKYGGKLLGMLSFLGMQVGGNPDGAHAAFKDHAVDAVTVRMGAGRGQAEDADAVTGNKVLRVAAAVEGVMRCSNNLLERLHHSYFMYLQPNPNTFITIETYVLPACLMLLGLFLLAVSILMPTRKPPPQSAAVPEQSLGSSSPSVAGRGKAERTSPGSGEKLYPEKAVQPIRLLAGWQELSQGLCIVLVMHSACAVAGLLLHWVLAQTTQGHKVWDSMNVSISASVLVSGAVSAWGLLGLLASTAGAPRPNSALAGTGQAERSISLLLTVLLMGAWMFVNWADVYMALLCLIPNLLLASCAPAHRLSAFLGMGWLVINPWVVAMAGGRQTTQPGGWPLPHLQWLTNVSFVTYLFVWIVYVPSWVLPWWSVRGQSQLQKATL